MQLNYIFLDSVHLAWNQFWTTLWKRISLRRRQRNWKSSKYRGSRIGEIVALNIFFAHCRSSTSSMGMADGALPQYQVDKSFADRRYKVQSARTYFYLNEATCERNMETFLKCLEAVSGNLMTFIECVIPIRVISYTIIVVLVESFYMYYSSDKFMWEGLNNEGVINLHHVLSSWSPHPNSICFSVTQVWPVCTSDQC